MKLLKISLLLAILITTTGCWDQNFLSKTSLAFSLGFDKGNDPKNPLELITIIRALKPASAGEIQPYNTSYKVKGASPLILREKMNEITPGVFSINKLSNVIIGADLAKSEIYPLLDVLYRDAKSNVSAKIVVTKGRAKDLLKEEYLKGTLISKALKDLLDSAESHSVIPEQSLASIMPAMFDPGQDFVLPYVEKIDDKLIKVRGVALFDKLSYTGKNLIGEDASLYLLMVGKEGAYTQFTVNNPKKEKGIDQKVSFFVRVNKHKIKLKIMDSKPVYSVSLKLKVSVAEYTKGLLKQDEIKTLEKHISKELTKQAKKVTDLLIDSDCDALALGRKLMIKDPKLFDQLQKNGMLDLKNVEIQPTVKVKVVDNGILD